MGTKTSSFRRIIKKMSSRKKMPMAGEAGAPFRDNARRGGERANLGKREECGKKARELVSWFNRGKRPERVEAARELVELLHGRSKSVFLPTPVELSGMGELLEDADFRSIDLSRAYDNSPKTRYSSGLNRDVARVLAAVFASGHRNGRWAMETLKIDGGAQAIEVMGEMLVSPSVPAEAKLRFADAISTIASLDAGGEVTSLPGRRRIIREISRFDPEDMPAPENEPAMTGGELWHSAEPENVPKMAGFARKVIETARKSGKLGIEVESRISSILGLSAGHSRVA